MKRDCLLELREIYRRELFDRVIPFCLRHSLDCEHGGQFISLDRAGQVFDSDRSMWLPGRALWLCWKLLGQMLDSRGDHCRT